MATHRLPDPLPAPRGPWSAAILALFGAALYLRTLGNGFVTWDDPQYVEHNPFATRGLAGILAAFAGSHEDAYYPLTHAVYGVVQAVAGTSPFAHHLVQLAVFAAALALLPRALAAFRVPPAIGFWTAVLFAAHPLRVESVAWVANLKDTLSLLLVLAAFALFASGRRPGSAAAFAGALLAKSMLFPVALLFPLLAFRDGARPRDALFRSWPWLVPAAILAAVAAALHLVPDAPRSVPGGSLLAAIPSALWLPWWYVGRILVPRPSQAIHAFDPVGWADGRLVAAAILWGLVAFAVARLRAGTVRDRLLAAAAFALPFAAVTGLVPLVFPVADRYALLPSLPVLALVVAGVAHVARRFARGPAVAAAVLVLVTAGLGTASVIRQGEWRDPITFWEADRARNPDHPAVRIALSGAYGGAGRWDDAIAELEAVRRLDPSRARTASDLAMARAAKAGARTEEALAVAAAVRDGAADRLLPVAGAALREGRAAVAAAVLDAALELAGTAPAHALAAQAAAAEARHDDALAHAEGALALEPGRADATVSRARALAELGRFDEALAATEVPLADRRQRAILAAVRAYVLSATGREDEARAVLEAVRADLPRVAGP